MLISGWWAPTHLLPSLAVADLKIFPKKTLILDSETLGRRPHADPFHFASSDHHLHTATHVGRVQGAVRLSASAVHELWEAPQAIPSVSKFSEVV